MFNFNTDLADERRELYKQANKLDDEISGIETKEEQTDDNIMTTIVKVLDEEGAKAIGKPIGEYTTIDIKKLKIATEEAIQKASEVVTKDLKKQIDKHVKEKADILIVGLGNNYVTPDSLRTKSN